MKPLAKGKSFSLLRVLLLTCMWVALSVPIFMAWKQSWSPLVAIERMLVYFPERALAQTPQAAGLAFRDVDLRTGDGLRLHGWFIPQPAVWWTCLYLHGNGGNIGGRVAIAAKLYRAGCQVALFDYRGYGRSEGIPDEQGLYRDAETMHHWLVHQAGVPAERIVVFGESLGGAVAIALADRLPVGALITKSTFTSLADMARLNYGWLPMHLVAGSRYPSSERIGRIKVPKLFIHGTDDETIPFAMGEALYQAAIEPKAFYPVRGAHHNDTATVGGEVFVARLTTFLAAARHGNAR